MSDGLDHWLDEFGGSLDPIYSRARHVKEPRKPKSKPKASSKRRPTGPATRESRRATLERIARKSPEVMVKITGGGRNMRQIKAHMDYISRNGELEIEDEQGLAYQGKKDVRYVRDTWRDGGHTIPYEGEDGPREAFNIMLSMPAGTDRTALKDAARAFAAEHFEGHQYVFAGHDDKNHFHVHLTVKAVGLDGERLNPRKGDLHRWRVSFAEQLRERGVDANASPRKARGVVRKAQRQALRGITDRNGKSRVLRKHQAEAIREARGRAEHPNPAQDRISATRKRTLRAYGEISKELAKGDASDQRLALQLVDLVKTMPPLTTAHETRVHAIRATLPQGRDHRGGDRSRDDRGHDVGRT
ncbi:relaxase/mobilization nuclease domain-containing protein [Aminobacter sp. MSH1]|uniref:relaxase/mobilization nuclease domain-containing protein n=1 Tax=Aminobacter sp. MSH1 TaxID=374606 RepID=UPI001900C810|nr:relaxase/mobilization nuclease domain-containing protein [Aminobacter sp. MSH1]